jgi:hypothetical protein
MGVEPFFALPHPTLRGFASLNYAPVISGFEKQPLHCSVANVKELSEWLGRESHMPGPARILTGDTDVAGAQSWRQRGSSLKDLLRADTHRSNWCATILRIAIIKTK